MRKTLLILILLLFAITADAHDLFLRLENYFLPAGSKAIVKLLNGDFQSSDGLVARERMRDISVLAPDLRRPIAESVTWSDQGKTTLMEIQTGGPGTYVVGVSTNPKLISLKAAEFNDYLAHDGVPDILEARRKDDQLDMDVRERYSKHVRAIFQVGDVQSNDYKKALNYPVEIIPQQNPYSLRPGQSLAVMCTLDGQPLDNQFVIAGWEAPNGNVKTMASRTSKGGIAQFKLLGSGKWFVKFIHMRPISEPGLNYESKWATLTFEIKKPA